MRLYCGIFSWESTDLYNALKLIEKNKKHSAGITTLEIIISLAIVAVVVPAVMALVFSGQVMVVSGSLQRQALGFTEYYLKDNHFSAKDQFLQLDSTTALVDDIQQSVGYLDLSSYAKLAAVKSSLGRVLGIEQYVEIKQLFVDLDNFSPTETCSLQFVKDWSQPEVSGTFDMVTFGPAVGLDVANGKMYVVVNPGVASAPDLVIADITNPKNINVIASLNTGPGLEDIVAVENYLYTANTSSNSHFQIIDIHNSANPVVIKNFKINGITSGGMGHKIFYYSNKIYLGLTKAGGAGELHIIDVTNPTVPIWQGQFEFDTMVNDLFVSNNWAFVSTPEKELRVLDITDPANIIEMGSGFTAPAVANHPGKSLYVLGKKVLVGRSLAGFDSAGQNELYSLGTSDFISGFNEISSLDADYSVRDMLFRSNKVFVTGNGHGKEFEVYNLSPDFRLAYFSSLALPDSGTVFDCEGENFFVALESVPAIIVVGGQ